MTLIAFLVAESSIDFIRLGILDKVSKRNIQPDAADRSPTARRS
jgi:hypothetical protein